MSTKDETMDEPKWTNFCDRKRRKKPDEAEIQELRRIFASKMYSPKELKKLEETSGRSYKRGKFTIKERAIIREGLKEFLDSNGLTHEEFITAFFTSKQRAGQLYTDNRFKQLFKHVAAKLDGRPTFLTYKCMWRMYHPGNFLGTWSEAEDKELHRLIAIHGPDWSTIAIKLGRFGLCCRDRYKLLRGKVSTGPWSEEEIEKLKNAISYVKSRANNQPCWLFVSEAVGTRSPCQCQTKWAYLEMSLRNGPKKVWTSEVDYLLVCQLYDLAVEHESEIVWREVATDNWPVYICSDALRRRFHLLCKRVPNSRNITMDELLESLMLSLRPKALSPKTETVV